MVSLAQIWLAHMRFIFDQTPFAHAAILSSIRTNVRQTIAEDQCHSLL
jgi:hypothetical protein